jgi:phenylpropionate dioxygenase-like ring-hydroxylating dioxygenase large terminal subunit
LLGAPLFEDKPCVKLANTPLQNWHGLLFEGERNIARDLKGMGAAGDFDFSGYMLDRVEIKTCNYNWKTFIEVYLEDYHVAPFHPGLGQFVTCDDLRWQFSDRFSVQTVGVNSGLAKPGTKTYERWHKAVLDYYRGEPPEHGAIWATIYPNVMIEWYAHVLIVSSLIPDGVDRTSNIVEFLLSRRKSPCSSARVRRQPSRRRTWKPPPSETMKSANAWRPAGAPCGNAAAMNSARTSRRWRMACSNR